MDIKKLNPWNWFKHEEDAERQTVPVQRQAETRPATYTPLLSVHQEIDRMFDNVFRNFGLPSLSFSAGRPMLEGSLFRPNLDVEATDKEYRITVEAPGVDEKDLKLELTPDGALVLKGEKKHLWEDKTRDQYRVERSYGSFQRILALPEDADQNNIDATLKNGVLAITVPRKSLPQSEMRRISIKSVNDR